LKTKIFIIFVNNVSGYAKSCNKKCFENETIIEILLKGCHLDVVGGPSTPHDPESYAGGSLSSWQGHPSR
jgi:hypothetical protein